MLTRIDKPGRRTFQPAAAKAAGFPLEVLDEFWKIGEPWTEYRVTRANEAGDIDYGEAPF
jgi:hypothetical protein